ncbi:hypothetical protein SGQ44_13280 [Flavobacterium sp. Fl-77]|uniref:Uncharacterized protein n=1 Tax=Flavobacterium flavipigmentatum TaxID=2893884 RepID=A0AAJ2VYS5_9FLAO|nr:MULTISPECIES: hypothetical protein [unclassified Flavobacterium]MDX6183451.1 hypothetical protein [Flavobacterium sp. Fl-33]MDX6186735.1 hypothetical protein [Flavobacterium sp. Fl-77]UFH38497.1 hypothetical protein LNP22_17445 [Flavobacterium sp. F-70]
MKTAITLANTIPTEIKSEHYLVFSMIIITVGKSLEPKIPIEVNTLIMSFLAISLIGMTLQIVNNLLKNKILFDTFQKRY